MTTTLADRDRETLAKARKMADLLTADAIREHLRDATLDTTAAYALAFAEARWLLAEMASIVTRGDQQ